jgi:hypothetical protein
VHSLGQGGPALGEEGPEQGQDFRVGLQIEKERQSQRAPERITSLLVTAHLEQGPDDMKAVADIF